MVHLPYSKSKRYLTGVDWVIHALDYMTKRATGVGNISQIVLELDGSPDEGALRKCLAECVNRFPVVHGSLARDYNLAPYWKMPLRMPNAPLPLTVHRLERGTDSAAVHLFLERGLNAPFENAHDHLAFRLVRAGEKSFLAMTFDHRLFDAWGAEAFLGMVQRAWESEGSCIQKVDLTEPAHLCRWKEKFEAGKQVNRALLHLVEGTPARSLPLPSASMGRGFRFRLIPFDDRQTAAITETAYRDAGYLMFMPYALAASTWALHQLFTKRSIPDGDYVLSVSIDMRPMRKRPQDMFFNHLSFLLFRIRPREMKSFQSLLSAIKQQMYEQVRSQLPRNLSETWLLTRIAPLPLMRHVMQLYFKGRMATFSFSYVGESAYEMPGFMGKKIHNSFHMPRVPVPPGLGVFFNRFQGRLNAVLSYMDGLLRDDEVDAFVQTLQHRLGV